jgi:hypothetical protein
MRRKSGIALPPPPIVNRRRFLKGVGLGALGFSAGGSVRTVVAQDAAPVNRILLYVTDHGTVQDNWKLRIAASGSATQVTPLAGLADSAWSPILTPLKTFAPKLNVIEGIGRAPEIDYEKRGGEGDRHTFGQTMLLTCVDSITESDIMGGGPSVDQVIGAHAAQPGRWAARVYGANHYKSYSFTAAGRPTPLVSSPETAFDDVLGLYTPPDDPPGGGEPPAPTREQLIRTARGSVLDFVADEYDFVAPRLPRADRLKLEEHRQLVRDLELTFQSGGGGGNGSTPTAACTPDSYTDSGADLDKFGRIASLAFSCDMTRVVLVIGRLASGDFSIPSGKNFHQDIAHAADMDPLAAEVMTEFNTAYARHFATLLGHMDGIQDVGGTLLDNTITTWLTELATGPHELDEVPYVVAGKGAGFLRTGQHVRYPRTHRVDGAWATYDLGGSNAQLYVTLMKAMGMPDDSFGVTDVQGMPIRGPLAEIMA